MVYFKNTEGKEVPLYCEVAKTPQERARGLMFRKFLGENEGMIFVYPKPQILRFWMRETSIPLSLAYVSSDGLIVEIHDLKPFDESIISSSIPVQYAIEVNRGWFQKNHIVEGSRIRIEKK